MAAFSREAKKHLSADPLGIPKMYDCTNRITSKLGLSRRSKSGLQDNYENRENRYYNCFRGVARYHSSISNQTSKQEKLRFSKPAFLSSSRRMEVGSTSRRCSTVNNHAKLQRTHRSTLALQERSITESCSRQVQEINLDIHGTEMVTQSWIVPLGPGVKDKRSAVSRENNRNVVVDSRNCEGTSITGIRKLISKKKESRIEGITSSSTGAKSFVPRNDSHINKASHDRVGKERKHVSRNLNCKLKSDAMSCGFSSSDIHWNKTDALRKRCADVGTSAAKGKRKFGSLNRGDPGLSKNYSSGLSLLRKAIAQPVSSARNQLRSRNCVFPIRTKSCSVEHRKATPEEDHDNIFLNGPCMIPPTSKVQVSLNRTVGSRSTHHRPRSPAHFEDHVDRASYCPPIRRDDYEHFYNDGIEEQLTVSQSNILSGGLGFRDLYSDWRMDIDNMSYEELLALGEKMGTVSAALSEEELLKSLRTSTYTHVTESRSDAADVNCSICQEEYTLHEEVSTLRCDHHYHTACIHQWLQQKNWCPICKSSARSS